MDSLKRFFSVFVVCFVILFFQVETAHAKISSSTAEIQLLNLMNQARLKQNLSPLKLDRTASRICRFHSFEMSSRDFFSLKSPQRGTMEYKLVRNGVFGRILKTFILIDRNIPNILNNLNKNKVFGSKDATHIGIGFYITDSKKYGKNAMWLTLVFLNHLVQLDNIPLTIKPAQKVTIKGEILQEKLINPRMPLTLPNGRVKELRNRLLNQDKRFEFEFESGLEKGKYTLEILVDHKDEGPKVAAIVPIYVGIAYPPPQKINGEPAETFKTTEEASKYMFKVLNQARSQHKLKALKSDALLQVVAYNHSKSMAQNDFFSHINPEGKNPTDRYNDEGGFGDVGENIAYDITMQSAHKGLMNSPGHRANILNKNYTHVGIGVYFDGKQYYTTQLFQKKLPIIKTESVEVQLLNWLNQKRKEANLSPLIFDFALNKTAREHSMNMSTNSELAYSIKGVHFSEALTKNKGKYKDLSIYVLVADSEKSARNQMGQIMKHVLNKKFSQIGIGVYQGSSRQYGENVLWVTLGLISI